MSTLATTPLRDVIEPRLAARWQAWSADHPHLAAAIDRVRLTESAVRELRAQPDFRAAMRQAALDEAQLAAAARVLEHVDAVIARVLP